MADPSVLPDYPYRDDGLMLYNAINKYVTSIVEARYGKENHWSLCALFSKYSISRKKVEDPIEISLIF